VTRISEDLAEAVVGVDVSELLVGCVLVGGGRVAGGAMGPLAGRGGGIAKLALEVGELPLKVRIDMSLRSRALRRRRSPAAAHNLGVSILDLLEAPRRFERATVVIRMVKLRQPPIRRPNLLVGRFAGDPEDLVWIAPARRHLSESVVHALARSADP
jgi:hypothetical protein